MEFRAELLEAFFESSPRPCLLFRRVPHETPDGENAGWQQVAANRAARRLGDPSRVHPGNPFLDDAYPELLDGERSHSLRDALSRGELPGWRTGFEGVPLYDKPLSGEIRGLGHEWIVVEIGRPASTSPDSASEGHTLKMESALNELDAFTYSISHDLRAPLRRLDGFSQELLGTYGEKLDDQGRHYLKRIRAGAQQMGVLIDDLLKLSRISRREIERTPFNLGDLATLIFEEYREVEPGRKVELELEGELGMTADRGLIRSLMENLISNAWKFTRPRRNARLAIGAGQRGGHKVYYVKDNGVGFDMAYAGKLFRPFQRLHSDREFEGTGIGLATARRILSRHGGSIWAESEPGRGTTISFCLTQPEKSETHEKV